MLEPQIVVQSPRVMLVNDEDTAGILGQPPLPDFPAGSGVSLKFRLAR